MITMPFSFARAITRAEISMFRPTTMQLTFCLTASIWSSSRSPRMTMSPSFRNTLRSSGLAVPTSTLPLVKNWFSSPSRMVPRIVSAIQRYWVWALERRKLSSVSMKTRDTSLTVISPTR